MHEEKKKTSNEEKGKQLTSSHLFSFFGGVNLQRKSGSLLQKSLLKYSIQITVKQVWKYIQITKLGSQIQDLKKYQSKQDICGSLSGNFASCENGKYFIFKMMTQKFLQLQNTQPNQYYRPFLKDKYLITKKKIFSYSCLKSQFSLLSK